MDSFFFKIILFLIFIFWLHHTACGILGPRPGIEPVSPALAAQILNHWTTMEVPASGFLTTRPPGKPPDPVLIYNFDNVVSTVWGFFLFAFLLIF